MCFASSFQSAYVSKELLCDIGSEGSWGKRGESEDYFFSS